MLTLITKDMELRGIQNVQSKKGNTYYVIYCEDMEKCEPYKFFCKDFKAIPEGLKKGDIVSLRVRYNSFKDLEVIKVEKC